MELSYSLIRWALSPISSHRYPHPHSHPIPQTAIVLWKSPRDQQIQGMTMATRALHGTPHKNSTRNTSMAMRGQLPPPELRWHDFRLVQVSNADMKFDRQLQSALSWLDWRKIAPNTKMRMQHHLHTTVRKRGHYYDEAAHFNSVPFPLRSGEACVFCDGQHSPLSALS